MHCLSELLTWGGGGGGGVVHMVYVGQGMLTGQHIYMFMAQSGFISSKVTAAAVHLQDDLKLFSLVHILQAGGLAG